MQKKLKKIPEFKSEDDERDFWSRHDSSEYVDWSKGYKAALPELKPSSRSISIRLPESMLHRLKSLANKRDIPYQSYIKLILQDRIDEEIR